MAKWKCAQCGSLKEGRCKPRKCAKCGNDKFVKVEAAKKKQ